MKAYFLLILLILPLFLEHNNITSLNEQPKILTKQTSSQINETQLKDNYSVLLQTMINGLLHQAESVYSNSSLRWKKYLNLPGNITTDSQYYYGQYYGAAGIGSMFIELYKETNNQTYLEIASKAGNYLLNSARITTNGYAWWTRSEDSNVAYSSEKYGLAGIATFLLLLYQETSNSTFLNYAESTLQLLYYYRIQTDHGIMFDYSLPLSSAITDLIYGVTGIAKSYLTAYEVTNNKTYLSISIESMNWVLNQTEYTSNDQNGLRKVLYSPDPSYNDFFIGYQSGASGIGDFLLQLYNVTNNQNYLLYAKQLANWVVYKENGIGYWDHYNAVDYLTDQYTTNEEGSFLGYSAGSSGVAIFLMDLFRVTNETKYLGPVQQVKDFLINQALKNGSQMFWKVQVTGNFANKILTGLSLGEAGIGLFFSQYYKLFGEQEVLTVLSGIKDFYFNVTTNTGLVPYQLNTADTIYDSSYLDGLTGIISFINSVNVTLDKLPLYNSLILNNLGNFTFPSQIEWIPLYTLIPNTNTMTGNCFGDCITTSSSSQGTITAGINYVPIILVVIPILASLRKKYK